MKGIRSLGLNHLKRSKFNLVRKLAGITVREYSAYAVETVEADQENLSKTTRLGTDTNLFPVS